MDKIIKYATAEIVDVRHSASKVDTLTPSSFQKLAKATKEVSEDGYLYVGVRAISSRVNKNNDGWPSQELSRGYKTFEGRPVFVDHNNDNPERTRGVVRWSKLYVEDQEKTSKLDPYYASAPSEHLPPTHIELMIEVDAHSFPKLAKEIVNGNIDAVSMGANIDYTICSVCANQAYAPKEYCGHIKEKGAEFEITSADGHKHKKKSYEDCYGVNFFEISFVFDPADETALIQTVDKKEARVAKKVTAGWEENEILLWIDNEQAIYDDVYNAARRALSDIDLARSIRAIIEEYNPEYLDVDLNAVDWEAVAREVLEQHEEREDYMDKTPGDDTFPEEWTSKKASQRVAIWPFGDKQKGIEAPKGYGTTPPDWWQDGILKLERKQFNSRGAIPKALMYAKHYLYWSERDKERDMLQKMWEAWQQYMPWVDPSTFVLDDWDGMLEAWQEFDKYWAIESARPEEIDRLHDEMQAEKTRVENDPYGGVMPGPLTGVGSFQSLAELDENKTDEDGKFEDTPQSEMVTAPQQVDTLRSDHKCRRCESDMDEAVDGVWVCPRCGWEEEPTGLGLPDLDKAMELRQEKAEREEDNVEEQAEEQPAQETSQLPVEPKTEGPIRPVNPVMPLSKTASVSQETIITYQGGIHSETVRRAAQEGNAAQVTYPDGTTVPLASNQMEHFFPMMSAKEASGGGWGDIPITVSADDEETLQRAIEIIHSGGFLQ